MRAHCSLGSLLEPLEPVASARVLNGQNAWARGWSGPEKGKKLKQNQREQGVWRRTKLVSTFLVGGGSDGGRGKAHLIFLVALACIGQVD